MNAHHPEIPFEILGYYEEAILPNGKGASWKIKTVPAVLGSPGARNVAFKKGATLMIDKGHKPPQEYVFREDCVLRVTSHALCGHMIERKAA